MNQSKVICISHYIIMIIEHVVPIFSHKNICFKNRDIKNQLGLK